MSKTNKIQADLLYRQAFETTFFNSLDLFHRVSVGMKYAGYDGSDAVKALAKATLELDSENPHYEDLMRIFYEENQASFGPYMGTLQTLLELIERSDLDANDEKYFAYLVRTTMSFAERGTVMCIVGVNPGEALKALCEKYGIFLSVERYYPSPSKYWKKLFDESAFPSDAHLQDVIM